MTKRPVKTELNPRKKGTREIESILLIVCEGESEVVYFREFQKDLANPRVMIKPYSGKHTDAPGILEDAKEFARQESVNPSGNNNEHVWCVFDRDQNSKNQLNRAEGEAKFKGYHIAFSNPCIEIWYLLHFEYRACSYDSSEKVKKALKEKLRGYEETSEATYRQLKPSLHQALVHAKRLEAEEESVHDGSGKLSERGNPYTTVHHLIEMLETYRILRS